VYYNSGLDLHQGPKLFCIKIEIFLRKVLVFREKVVPLHPLSGSDLLSNDELPEQREKNKLAYSSES
jgi:hypothetical protein